MIGYFPGRRAAGSRMTHAQREQHRDSVIGSGRTTCANCGGQNCRRESNGRYEKFCKPLCRIAFKQSEGKK